MNLITLVQRSTWRMTCLLLGLRICRRPALQVPVINDNLTLEALVNWDIWEPFSTGQISRTGGYSVYLSLELVETEINEHTEARKFKVAIRLMERRIITKYYTKKD